MDDKAGGDKHRRGLFKLSGFRFTFKGRNRKSHPGFRTDSDKGKDYNFSVFFFQKFISYYFLEIYFNLVNNI